MNKVIVISGASSGLGVCLAKKFIGTGDIVFGASKTKKNWVAAKKIIRKTNRFSLFSLDLSKEQNVNRFLSTVFKKAGKIDVLINCTGYAGSLSRVENLRLSEFQKYISYNLFTAFLMCKHVIPIFRKQNGGIIVNISSMAGKRAVPQLAAYSASKFGVLALSQSIAKENLDSNFKCITICPGGINTRMRARLFGKKDAIKQQSADFVAEIICQAIDGTLKIDNGGDIIIRHNRVVSINPLPPT